MSILYSCKVFAGVINDTTNVYYSDAKLDALLATGEKFCIEVKTTNVTGTTPAISVQFETSDDGTVWAQPTKPISAQPIASGTVLFGYELGTTIVVGRQVRFGSQLGGTNAQAYVEVWVTGRDAR